MSGTGLSEALCNEQVWLVDPLDGTVNFVSGSPLWAVMVALVRGGERQRQRGSGARRQGHVSSGTWCWSDTKRDSDRSASGFLDGQRSPRVRPDKFLDAPTKERVDMNRRHFGSVAREPDRRVLTTRG